MRIMHTQLIVHECMEKRHHSPSVQVVSKHQYKHSTHGTIRVEKRTEPTWKIQGRYKATVFSPAFTYSVRNAVGNIQTYT